MNTEDVAERIEQDLKKARSRRDRATRTLKSADEEVTQLEAALVVMTRYTSDESSTSTPSRATGGAGTLLDFAVAIIVSGDRTWSIPELADAILSSPDYKYDGDHDTLVRSLRGLVSKAYTEGRVWRFERGRYGHEGLSPERAALSEESSAAPQDDLDAETTTNVNDREGLTVIG